MQFRRNAGLFRCRRGKQKYDARFSLKNYFRREMEERGGGGGGASMEINFPFNALLFFAREPITTCR